MKKKNEDNEMLKDDEVLREQAMTDGPATILGGIEMQPITALTVSWMQRNEIFSDAKDMIWKAAAFAYIHSAPKASVRSVVNDRNRFAEAVDIWIEKHLTHHLQATELSQIMQDAFSRYMSAASEIVGPKGIAPGN
jgi:hypothetical protein